MARSTTAIADIKLRLREPLRAQIEAAAATNGVSMNSEMVRRLEDSLKEEKALYRALGTPETFSVMRALGSVVASISEVSGRNWLEDKTLFAKCRKALDAVLDGMEPTGRGSSKVAPGLGKADAIAVLQRYVQDLGARWGIDVGEDDPELTAAAERIHSILKGN